MLVAENENPGASANATGVKEAYEATKLPAISSAKRGASAMSKYAKDEHKRAARSLGYALTLGTSDAWLDFKTIIAARLSKEERAGLAFAALRALDDETRAWWAAVATVPERKAYLWHGFWSLPDRVRSAFLASVKERRAAA